ncbi:MAG: hypothetical protein NXI20_20605 [bacterium]|nr:hypothetical protein [bacterium]
MKKLLIIIFTVAFGSLKAQEVNWRALNTESKHLVGLSFNADFTTSYGVSYAYKTKIKQPVLVGAEMQLPFGKKTFDDWKLIINAQTELWHSDNLSLAVKPFLIGRRYESAAAKLYNIGAGGMATFGFTRANWGIATEIGVDHSFASRITNGNLKEYYPEIQDGWYSSTGGNFIFNLKANWEIKQNQLFVKIGKIVGNNFEDNPTLPFFADISINRLF